MANKGEKPASEKKKRADVKDEELLVLHETKPNEKGSFYRIRVVRWIIDGVKQPPKLEKRGFYKNRKGDLMHGDHETMSTEDAKILGVRQEIIDAMEAGCFGG